MRFSAEDVTRTNFEILKKLYKKAEEDYADYISLADTVGIMNPRTTYYNQRAEKGGTNSHLHALS